MAHRTPLAPLPHHLAVVAHLRQHEPALWAWFSSARCWTELLEANRLQLLKSAVRLDRAAHAALYAAADAAMAALALDLPLTLYRATHGDGRPSAGLRYLPGEAHVVLQGPVQGLLDPAELRALFGHVLAYHALWSLQDGAFLLADRLLEASAAADAAENAHDVAARRYAQYTEIFADRGALVGAGDTDAVIRCLVKVQTGLQQVSAAAYLRGAEELFARGEARAEGLAHPELYIRARAIDRWDRGEDPDLESMVEGAPTLETLDLLQQAELTALTHRLLAWALGPPWMRSPAMLAHAQMFRSALEPSGGVAPDLGRYLEPLRDYWCYLLLDLAAADPALQGRPLAHVLGLAEGLGLRPRLEALARQELDVEPRTLDRLRGERST